LIREGQNVRTGHETSDGLIEDDFRGGEERLVIWEEVSIRSSAL
jgi:hypothetical protein